MTSTGEVVGMPKGARNRDRHLEYHVHEHSRAPLVKRVPWTGQHNLGSPIGWPDDFVSERATRCATSLRLGLTASLVVRIRGWHQRWQMTRLRWLQRFDRFPVQVQSLEEIWKLLYRLHFRLGRGRF